MALLVKSLMGIGLVGGAGLSLGGYYLFKESEPKTLEEKFKRERITILDYASTAANSDWDTKLNKYKTDESANRFEGLTKEAASNDGGLQKLKVECKKHLTKPIEGEQTNNQEEEKIKEWCTKPAS